MVEGRLHIAGSALLNDLQKKLILRKLAGKINAEGYLQCRSQVHRSQLENKEEVINKMARGLLKKGWNSKSNYRPGSRTGKRSGGQINK
jgi:ribosome-associated protein